MSDDKHLNLFKDNSELNMDFNGSSDKSNNSSKSVENKQEKPKRKRSPKVQQSSEPSGVGHIPEGGSTVQQSRRKRETKRKLVQELADKSGFIPDRLPDATQKPKSRRSVLRSVPPKQEGLAEKRDDEDNEDISSSDDDDDDDIDYALFMRGMMNPYMMMQMNQPSEMSVLDKVVSAFSGYPMTTHVTEIKPNKQKLVIEVEI